eukprot:gene3550-biopygen565
MAHVGDPVPRDARDGGCGGGEYGGGRLRRFVGRRLVWDLRRLRRRAPRLRLPRRAGRQVLRRCTWNHEGLTVPTNPTSPTDPTSPTPPTPPVARISGGPRLASLRGEHLDIAYTQSIWLNVCYEALRAHAADEVLLAHLRDAPGGQPRADVDLHPSTFIGSCGCEPAPLNLHWIMRMWTCTPQPSLYHADGMADGVTDGVMGMADGIVGTADGIMEMADG